MVQRILVVDDDKQIVRLLRTYLEQSGYQALVAYDGESALHIIRRERPDLVLLDLMLPDRDGWELMRIVRGDASLQGLPVIMLTARADDQDKIVGLELGADDYVAKPFNPREVVARLRAVLRRAQGEAPPPRMLHAGPLAMDVEQHQVQVQGRPVHLTRTEFKLLQVLVENPGRTFTRLELIEKALGYGYEGLERSVDSHVKNLRHKLDEANGGNMLIETVFGVGYRLPVGEEA
ncbi:MAG TPA: response regulator transcription factor [Anaerolineae bacterium]|nr:response regulator transcription factor [Anaerolineae bacterium]